MANDNTLRNAKDIFAKAEIISKQPTSLKPEMTTAKSTDGVTNFFTPIQEPVAVVAPKIPSRSETEYASLSSKDFMLERFLEKLKFDPKENVNQFVDMTGILDPNYSCTLSIPSGVFNILDKSKGSKHVGNMSFDQLYTHMFKTELMQDHQSSDDELEAKYQATYIHPSLNEITNVFKATNDDLPYNFFKSNTNESNTPIMDIIEAKEKIMQENIIDTVKHQLYSNDDDGVDPMPTMTTKGKRGRKAKDLFAAPEAQEQLVTPEPLEQQETPSISPLQANLQDIASSNISPTIKALSTIKKAVESISDAQIKSNVDKQNGVVDAGDINLENFHPSAEFIKGLSTIITEITKYIVQSNKGK